MTPSTEEPRTIPPPPSGPKGEFAAFYQATLAPLRNYLTRFLHNRAEAQDIAHDAFIRTYEALGAHPVDNLRAFLFVTARRLAINFRQRREGRVHPEEPCQIELKAGSTPDFTEAIMEQEAFDDAVRNLPPGCQQVLHLRFKEGLSHADIASRLGLAHQTVANHITRALRLLREHRVDAPPK